MDQHVIALFYRPALAARAMAELVRHGVEMGEISLFSTQAGAAECRRALDRELAAGAGGDIVIASAQAQCGATVSAGLCAAPIVAAGPLLVVSMAAYEFGSMAGSLVTALIKVGVSRPIAAHLEGEICDFGAVLVGVSVLRHDEARIDAILRSAGGEHAQATASSAFAL